MLGSSTLHRATGSGVGSFQKHSTPGGSSQTLCQATSCSAHPRTADWVSTTRCVNAVLLRVARRQGLLCPSNRASFQQSIWVSKNEGPRGVNCSRLSWQQPEVFLLLGGSESFSSISGADSDFADPSSSTLSRSVFFAIYPKASLASLHFSKSR